LIAKSKTFSVLIPDGENPLLFNVINCLSQIKGIKIYLISSLKENPFKHSRYIQHYSYYPKAKEEKDWVNNINIELEKFDIDLVMPIFEDGIQALTKYKNLIYKGRYCVLPSIEDFSIALNKDLLTKHMFNNQIQASKSIVIKPGETFKNESINSPFLIKPTSNSGGGVGIVAFSNEKDIENYFIENKFKINYLVEEYIEGYDICCNVLCDKGKILAYTIHKGIMKGGKIYGPSVELLFLYDDQLYKKIVKLMESLNWYGVANIDIRYDERAKEFKVIEINPRFWYNVDASAIAGVNFPYLYCLHSLGIDFQEPKYDFIKYLNLNGFIKSVKNNKLAIFNFKFIFSNYQLNFILKDPLQIFYRVYYVIKRLILKN